MRELTIGKNDAGQRLDRFVAYDLGRRKRPGVAIENIGKYVFYHIHITHCKLHIVFII